MSSPTAFADSVHWVLYREGVRWDSQGNVIETGLNDDPHDPGGVTKFGIAQRWHPGVDVKNLTIAQAIAIYKTEYWDKWKCDGLPDAWALFVFDSAVQHPPSAVNLFEQMNNICDALDRREQFYRSIGNPAELKGWLYRLAALRDKLRTDYGIVCPPAAPSS